MPEVYNWQLGRMMTYIYDEKHPKEQFTFVFNTNRCIACQTCTMAHKSTWTFSKGQEYMWWNNVETKPYGGYPQFWDWKILKMLEQSNPGQNVWNVRKTSNKAIHGVYEGVTIFEAPAKIGLNQQAVGYVPTDEEWRFPNFGEDTAHGREFTQSREGTFGGDNGTKSVLPEHKIWFFYLQRICNHCTYPGCLAACPRKAIYKRQEDGIVLIDQSRCRGYKKCVEQCPYKKPMFRGTTRISEKCIACYPRIEGLDPLTEGDQMETRCMAACVGKIRLQGLVKVGGKPSGIGPNAKTGSKRGSGNYSAGGQGAGNISKRSSNIDFGMGKNEGVFNPGIATKNILSDNTMRVSAVEDLNAEGFSTLTTQAQQDVAGEGNWRNNRWSVVFKRALKTGDSNDTQFNGGKTPMAIAIWNGGNKERNGQKAVTQWNTLHY